MKEVQVNFDRALQKVARGDTLSATEIISLLSAGPGEADRLFAVAREIRERHFGSRVFLYGFIYFSTWCKNNCTFCYYRVTNPASRRYRKNREEVLEAASQLAGSGVHLIDLTMGEDPQIFSRGREGFEELPGLVAKVKKTTGLPVMVSPGVVPDGVMEDLSLAGADWYACYQETHNRDLFGRLRPNQDYDSRFQKKFLARRLGLLVEEGILTGVGESPADAAFSMGQMRSLGAQQVRVMGFVPQRGTPMEGWESPPRAREMNIIAVLRLLFPDRLIPASLDVDGIGGLQERLLAGANVVTSLIPPSRGLAGVSRDSLDIEDGRRTVAGVLPVLAELGLEAAGQEEYRSWVESEKERLALLAGGITDEGGHCRRKTAGG